MRHKTAALAAAVYCVAQAACLPGCEEKKTKAPDNLPSYTLIYGGDVTFARRINEALFDEAARKRIFGDVEPLLQKADIALVNGEGVISAGGRFTDKGELRPYTFRAHPRMVDVLARAGVDIVTVGNNHSGDYGKEAFVEMLDRLSAAGIDYTGGGYNLADARTPAYRKVGDTVVAIVGADLTYTEPYRATPSLPGTLYFPAIRNDADQDRIVEELKQIQKEARKHAHVVLLTPHWGPCWVEAPSKTVKRLAARLIRAGYDGILGHSAHWFHGVELIDGKPVIYDAGNLVVDYGGGDDAHRDLLWELRINRAGVAGLTGYPLWLEKNRSTLAKGRIRDEILETLKKRSKAMGTDILVRDGVAALACDPGGVAGPLGSQSPPKRPAPQGIRSAPSDTVLDALPDDVEKVQVEYENGLKLIGYKLLLDEMTAPSGGQIVILYWTTDRKIGESYKVHLEARGADAKTGEPETALAVHLPGDWLLPTAEWPVGKVIQDWTLFRLTLKPEGKVAFYAGLAKGDILPPKSSTGPLVDGKLVFLGETPYRKGARGMFEVLETYRSPGDPKKAAPAAGDGGSEMGADE